jgi:predicted RND superfamily exporter protein
MKYILDYLRTLVHINYRHPVTVLSIALLLAIVSGYLSLQLKIDTDIANLLPSNNPHVVALDRLRDTIGGETEMDVAVKSPDLQANLDFSYKIIEESMKLRDPRTGQLFFNRVEFRKETEILKDYALYLGTNDELDELVFYLEDEIENAKMEANPFFVDFGFDDEDEGTDITRFNDVYNEIIPSEYPINSDSTVVLIKFYPTGSKSDLSFLRRMFASYDSLIVAMNPTQYHQEMEVRYGGRLKRHLMEIESITNDVYSSFSTGISSVLLLVMMYFFWKKYINYRRGDPKYRTHTIWSHVIRIPVSILVIGIPLLLSLTYTFGIAYLFLGTLNTMTSVLFVILFGLGIDYGLHFYARYLEKRSSGEEVLKALLNTYDSTGSAIMTSAITTAVALFVLLFADFRGFSEFGFISGLGIILAYLAMMYIMPALITVFERFGLILVNRNMGGGIVANIPQKYPYARSIVVLGIVLVVVVATFQSKLSFEYDFGKLEPEFKEYLEFREFVGNMSSTTRRNPAYIIADNNAQVEYILDEIRARKAFNGDQSTIRDVEALQERFPTNAVDETQKLNRIAEIRELLEDPFIRDQENGDLERLRRASLVTEPLSLDDLPDFIKDRYITRDGEIGRFVTIYPSVGLSDGRNSIAFKNEIAFVTTPDGNEFYSASTSIAAAEMLELMQTESPYMVVGTFLMIFILVNFAFRSLRWSIIAMIPLVIGLSWTFGIMLLFDIKFNFYNLVVLPAILGIGNDNGVHLAARYLEEGRNSMWNVLKSTGQHISIGSITTMMGFAGLLFTHHPGLYSIGLVAIIGIGMTLLSAITFLPALIQFLEDRNWIKFYDQPIR